MLAGAVGHSSWLARPPSLALPAPLAHRDTACGLLPALWDPLEPLELEATVPPRYPPQGASMLNLLPHSHAPLLPAQRAPTAGE